MIATLQWLLASKYGKVALEIAIVGALVFGAYKWAESRGRTAQKSADDQSQAAQIEKSREDAQRANDAQVSQATATAAAADSRARAAEGREAAAVASLQQLAGQQLGASTRVKALQNSDLHADVIAQLKLRPQGDTSACYTPAEERAIDDSVSQYPLCQKQSQALTGQVRAADAEAAAAKDKAAALEQAVNADQSYIATLQRDYKQLFDQHPPMYRSAKCLWLWHCRKGAVKFQLGQPQAAGSIR